MSEGWKGPLLSVQGLGFAYGANSGGDAPAVLDGVSFELAAGELTALVGANGSGKTTLLHLVLGVLHASRGEIRLGGDAVGVLPRREAARRVSLVPQDTSLPFAFTVRDIVAMGRNPHLGRFQPEGEADRAAVDAALAATGTDVLAGRRIDEVSGGERQRAFIARAVAQDTPLILMDEPTASLDLAHQLRVLELVGALTAGGAAVLAAMHDLSLAARFCDRLLVLGEGRLLADGPPGEVVTVELLERAFGIRARIVRDADASGGTLAVVPLAPVPRGEAAAFRLNLR